MCRALVLAVALVLLPACGGLLTTRYHVPASEWTRAAQTTRSKVRGSGWRSLDRGWMSIDARCMSDPRPETLAGRSFMHVKVRHDLTAKLVSGPVMTLPLIGIVAFRYLPTGRNPVADPIGHGIAQIEGLVGAVGLAVLGIGVFIEGVLDPCGLPEPIDPPADLTVTVEHEASCMP